MSSLSFVRASMSAPCASWYLFLILSRENHFRRALRISAKDWPVLYHDPQLAILFRGLKKLGSHPSAIGTLIIEVFSDHDITLRVSDR